MAIQSANVRLQKPDVEALRLAAFKFGFASGVSAVQGGRAYDSVKEIDAAAEVAWKEFKKAAAKYRIQEALNAN